MIKSDAKDGKSEPLSSILLCYLLYFCRNWCWTAIESDPMAAQEFLKMVLRSNGKRGKDVSQIHAIAKKSSRMLERLHGCGVKFTPALEAVRANAGENFWVDNFHIFSSDLSLRRCVRLSIHVALVVGRKG